MAGKSRGIQERTASDGTVSYRAQVRMRGHEHVSKTFTRKTDAKKWIEDTRSAIRAGSMTSNVAQRTTLHAALADYLKKITPKKKGRRREEDRVKAWQHNPLAHKFLTQLRGKDFSEYRDARRDEGVAEGTIRTELALISHLYKIARTEWGMEGLKNPIKDVGIPSGSNSRNRRLEEGEEEKLLTALKIEGPYMVPLATFAIETAMRQGEILSLAWADVDLEKRVAKLADTKNGEPREVALSSRAIEILKGLPRSLDASARVFPLRQDVLIRAFRAARTAAGLADLKYHDLRHEGISRLFERGWNVAEVAAMSGHRTWSQLKRYTHPKAEELAKKLA